MAIPSRYPALSLSLWWIFYAMTLREKAGIFLLFNVCVQTGPIFFLYYELRDDPQFEHFWDYVNCTLLFGLAFGMLLATISDSITDECHFSRRWRLLQAGS